MTHGALCCASLVVCHCGPPDGEARGAALVEQDAATRTTGSGLGQGRAGARAGTEVRETRDRPRGRDRDHGLRRREPEHHAQPRFPELRERTAARPDGGGTPRRTLPSSKTERVKRLRTDMGACLREDTVQKRKSGRHDAGEQTSTGKRGPRTPGRNYDSRSRESRRAASGQQARICRALCFQISMVDNLGRDKVTFARDGFAERAQNSQRVSMRSPIGTCVQSAPAWACGEQMGMSKGGVGVAHNRGESVCVHQRSDCVVSTRGLPHRATRRVSRAGVEGAVLAGCTRHGFTRPSAAEALVDRVNALLGLHHGAMMWNSGATSTCDRAQRPQVPAAARELHRSPPAHASGAGPDARSCPRKW